MIYFTEQELACKHCGLFKLHPGFDDALDNLRAAFGGPLIVRSCCRCKVHNDSEVVKGHPKSLHIGDLPAHAALGQQGTLGIDFETPDGAFRGRLFSLMWGRSWSIGWNARLKFLHGDRRDWLGMPQTTFDY